MRPADWAVAVWNKLAPSGTEVELTNDQGELENTVTRSEAWVLCNEPVVQVKGRTGGYSLWRIKPKGRSTAAALVLEAVQLHHQQCFNVLSAVVNTLRAAYHRRTPNIRPTIELRGEFIEQLSRVLADVDPNNNAARRGILDRLTAAPAVYAPFDPSVPFPPTDVEELRGALEAGQRAVDAQELAKDHPLGESLKAAAESMAAFASTPPEDLSIDFGGALVGSGLDGMGVHPPDRPIRGWVCAVCGLEVHHSEQACPDCKTERGCG